MPVPNRRTKITLIHHPTAALHVGGFTDPDLGDLKDGVYLGNTYERVMPASLLRVASVLKREPTLDVEIFDLRLSDSGCRQVYRTFEWDGQYRINVERVGGSFDRCNDRIEVSDWIGLSSHFTFESGLIRDLIRHIKTIKPQVKIMVGGADVKSRPEAYIAFGADLAFTADCDPAALMDFRQGQPVVHCRRSDIAALCEPAFALLPRLSDYVESYDGAVPRGVSTPVGYMYLSRGCPRECDFCEVRQTKFERLSLDRSLAALYRYRTAGISTINFTDDNLLLFAAKPAGRAELIELFRTMRSMGFAWEFPIGLEIGRLIKDGRLDEQLMEAMFDHSVHPATGRVTGAYRMYVPLETFERPEHYKKLRSRPEQEAVLTWLAGAGLREIDFGVVLPPSATPETFRATRDGYLHLRDVIRARGVTKARYAVFHLIPIALFRGLKTTFGIDEFPEAWNIYFPNYDGEHFTGRELFEQRLKLMKDIDRPNFHNMRYGRYTYG